MDLPKEKNVSSWRQHGFVVYPKAVTNFYVLRYLQWLIEGGTNAAYSTHHQSLWDIRMHKPVYHAFSDLIIFDAERCHLDLGLDLDAFWLPLTMIPAKEINDMTIQERVQYWHAKPFQTYLSPLGCKLLGLKSWEPNLP